MIYDSPARPVPAVSAAALPSTCSVPDSEPRVTRLVPPLYTDAMRAEHKAGLVDVSVYLESSGVVAKAVITRTSGDALLDGATYAAAVASTYAPEVRGCTYLAGSYVFRARYKADPVASSAHPTPIPNVPTEKPPFPPQPFVPIAVVQPADAADTQTTYAPSSVLTPAPARGGDPVAAPALLRPVRPIPVSSPGKTGQRPAPSVTPTPAP